MTVVRELRHGAAVLAALVVLPAPALAQRQAVGTVVVAHGGDSAR